MTKQTATAIRLRRCLKQTHLTPRQFARETGIPFRTLDNHLRGLSAGMRGATAEHVARKLSEKLRRYVDPKWLGGGQ